MRPNPEFRGSGFGGLRSGTRVQGRDGNALSLSASGPAEAAPDWGASGWGQGSGGNLTELSEGSQAGRSTHALYTHTCIYIYIYIYINIHIYIYINPYISVSIYIYICVQGFGVCI